MSLLPRNFVASLMILRLTRLAHGNHEMQRMLTEKGFAYTEALATLSAGGAMQKVARRYRQHVRANKRRLSRRTRS